MSDNDLIHGLCTGVYAETLGDQLAVAATVGATVLTVNDVADFEPGPGYVSINGVVYPYVTCDDDANTVTLSTALTAAAAVDDRVDLYDQANGQPATVYNAIVGDLDGFSDPAPIEATVSDQLAHALQQMMVDGNGVGVVLERDGGELVVVGILGRSFALAALQLLQGGMTTRTGEDQSGIDIIGTTSTTPGVLVYGPNGVQQMAITADATGGLIKFWRGVASETPGYLNPQATAAQGNLKIATPTDPTDGPVACVLAMFSGLTSGGVTAPSATITGGLQVTQIVTADAGARIGATGRVTSGMDWGHVNAPTTDSSGQITISHALGATPIAVQWTDENGNAPLRGWVVATSINASTFKVQFRNTTTNAVAGSGVSLGGGHWIALM